MFSEEYLHEYKKCSELIIMNVTSKEKMKQFWEKKYFFHSSQGHLRLSRSPFLSINEVSISWKFQLHTYYQSIFVAIWNFWLFRKSCKIWVWTNFIGQFLENWILKSFQSQLSLKLSLNFWNQKKYFIWNIEKMLKLGVGLWRLFKI